MWMCNDGDIRLDKTGRLKLWDCVIIPAVLSAKELITETVTTQASLLS